MSPNATFTAAGQGWDGQVLGWWDGGGTGSDGGMGRGGGMVCGDMLKLLHLVEKHVDENNSRSCEFLTAAADGSPTGHRNATQGQWRDPGTRDHVRDPARAFA